MRSFLLPSVISYLLLVLRSCVAAQEPKTVYTKLSHRYRQLYIFANSLSALYVDNGTGNWTNDNGETWSEVDVPVGQIRLHPFDNRYAFIETNEGPFYRTADRGLSWQPFEFPLSPSYFADRFSFHAGRNSSGYILISGKRCETPERTGLGRTCHTDYYYTRDAFASDPTLLLPNAASCHFAHSSRGFVLEAPHDLVFCTVSDQSDYSSKLFASSDFFLNDKRTVDFGPGRNSYKSARISFVGGFAVAKLYTESEGGHTAMTLLSSDLQHWERARIPKHRSSGQLSSITTRKLTAFDANLGLSGTLYVSDENGSFVQSLKDVRNDLWAQPYEYDKIAGVDHVGIANVLNNSTDPVWDELQSRISFDEGSTWTRLAPSIEDASNAQVPCDLENKENCSLHFNPPVQPQSRIFGSRLSNQANTTSPAAGVVIRIGSIGKFISSHTDLDTFLSTDGGLTWKMVMRGSHRFAYADHGSVIVLVKDVDDTDEVLYSTDTGGSWDTLKLEHKIRPSEFHNAQDMTSRKFLLIGRIAHEDEKDKYSAEMLSVFMDFTPVQGRQCVEDDFERWYLQDKHGRGCILGHEEWYLRRKLDRDCYVGQDFDNMVHKGTGEVCSCTRDDYECNFNYVKKDEVCVPVVPESIPAGACRGTTGTYLGPSGYRLKANNECNKHTGIVLDEPIQKDCSAPDLPEGEMGHKVFEFPAEVVQSEYLKDTTTDLVRLRDGTVYRSLNAGYSWSEPIPGEHFLNVVIHPYSPDRAYLLTKSDTYAYTTDSGRNWNRAKAPLSPGRFGSPTLAFSQASDHLIWVGESGCNGDETTDDCHAEAHYSIDHGREWRYMESYVRKCMWNSIGEIKTGETPIICESYGVKEGNQLFFNPVTNPLQLVHGAKSFEEKQVLVQNVIGFATISGYLIAANQEHRRSLGLQVSRNGLTFSEAIFPRGNHPQNHAYMILDASSESIFIHLTTSEYPNPYWGVILKSSSDGVVYVKSLEYVNRDDRGIIDFVKLPDLKGVALANVVANPEDSTITGRKELRTRISHNDGGTWRPLSAPKRNWADQEYLCPNNDCALHLHAFSERPNSRSSLAIASRPDVLISVGSVGDALAPYKACDTFLSRDAGFTWEKIQRGTHVWALADHGSLLVMARDTVATDRVIYSTDEGLTWHDFKLKLQDEVRVRSIVAVPQDTGRRFVLLGYYPQSIDAAVAVHLDFSSLTKKQCVNSDKPTDESDYEFWSPSVDQHGKCMFGRQTIYQRRLRDQNCYIGELRPFEERVIGNCPCEDNDFECEFNHVRDINGVCVLVPGTLPLENNTVCTSGEDAWYERTAYRKIGYSTCDGGVRLDRGAQHECVDAAPDAGLSNKKHSWVLWSTVVYLSLALAVLVAYVLFRCSGLARGKIRLAEDGETELQPKSSILRRVATPLIFLGRPVARGSRVLARIFAFRSRGGNHGSAGSQEVSGLMIFEEERDG